MAITSSKPTDGTEDFSRFTTRRLGATRERVRSVAWNLDGRRLATGGQDRSLRIYLPEKDPRTSTECRGHQGEVTCVRWSPAHPERLASCSASAQDKSLHFWDIRQGSKPTSTIETFGDNLSMTWSPDGKTIVLGNRSDKVLWVDVEEQRIVRKEENVRETNEALFSHNGSLLFTAVEGQTQITAFPSADPVYSINMSGKTSIQSLDLDPKGRYLASGGNDTTLTLWETEEWTCTAASGVHDDPTRICRFSPDGNYIASTASSNDGIVISEVPSLTPLHTISSAVSCDSLAWHPTKNLLAWGGAEACIWGAGI